MVSGAIATLDQAEQILAAGQADVVGMVRALIADPGLLAIDVDQVTEALADLPAVAAPRPARRAALRGRVA